MAESDATTVSTLMTTWNAVLRKYQPALPLQGVREGAPKKTHAAVCDGTNAHDRKKDAPSHAAADPAFVPEHRDFCNDIFVQSRKKHGNVASCT